MLVLSRHAGEEIVIDHDIRIAVLSASRNAVRLGVVAPQSVRVLREEAHDRSKQSEAASNLSENEASASGNSTIMAGVIRLAR